VRVNVGRKNFTNFEGESGGATTFADDFAKSCNTAFIDASRRLSGTALSDAATAMGVGAPWHLPVDAFGGSVPASKDAVEQAADAIGQGRVEVSPLTLALVAAAIEDGTPRPPVLVTDPPQRPVPAAHPLDPGRLAALRSLMRRVVSAGTAAGAGLPSGTLGKTGTAEFGTDNPPKTHAWFAGVHGSVAFAVLVEGGGVGGRVAAPIAARFLRLLG
jgi:cell division protein FtsI/penicillin-binding protein 2